MHESTMKLWQTIAISMISSAFALLLGYDISQSKLATKLADLGSVVSVNSNRLTRIEDGLKDSRSSSELHMKEALDLFRREIDARTEVDREFIATMKTQNDILRNLIKP